MPEAVKVIVRGRVQGVGFRPFIYQLAVEGHLKGTVQNNMDGVRIIWEGNKNTIERLVPEITRRQPRLARVDRVETEAVGFHGYSDFSIIPSDPEGKSELVIPVDSATCDECLKEMHDPNNFRYRYPFINCTQCGPRYTIIEGLPYDRPLTSMKNFEMCDRCAEEYTNPANRRHHAQPIACDACGPHVSLLNMEGKFLAERDPAIRQAAGLLDQGKIVAVKGIGGFHLACDAARGASVQTLRDRKKRPAKPLAVMVRDLDAARRIAFVSPAEGCLLQSPEAPIVLLRKKEACRALLAEAVAPGVRTIGLMLPYTPLHHLLFDDGHFDYLIMTSANPSGLPILYENDRAQSYLKGIADFILLHNRKILHPVDDSVVQLADAVPFFLRRSRGYVPDPVKTDAEVDGIIALGSQMKNTFAIGRGHQVIIGPHLGDLDAEESQEHYRKTLAHLIKWTGIRVHAVARDLHPLYSTRNLAETFGARVIDVQHHHAHLVSCMADNRLKKPCIGIILDGTGYGSDGGIWGFEILYGDAASYRRLAHLRETPLPGADHAIHEPWRNAAAMLIELLGSDGMAFASEFFPDRKKELAVLRQMVERRINSPMAGTCGRLFDAVSAILGICRISDYDGQAAIELSDVFDPAAEEDSEAYPFQINEKGELLELDCTEMLRQICLDHLNKVSVARISRRFHDSIALACCRLAEMLTAREPALGKTIVLSGGSMSNGYLSHRLTQMLETRGYAVFGHHRFPNGDGGLSIGQLMIAARQISQYDNRLGK